VGNIVTIETRTNENDGFDVHVSDNYDAGQGFWLEKLPDNPNRLAAECMLANGSAADILGAAIENDSTIDTTIGYANAANLRAQIDILLAEREQLNMEGNTPEAPQPGGVRRGL
jgi:hypothetical protein